MEPGLATTCRIRIQVLPSRVRCKVAGGKRQEMQPATMFPWEEAILRNHDRETHPKVGRQEARGQGRGQRTQTQRGGDWPLIVSSTWKASSLPHLTSSPLSSAQTLPPQEALLMSLVAVMPTLCPPPPALLAPSLYHIVPCKHSYLQV